MEVFAAVWIYRFRSVLFLQLKCVHGRRRKRCLPSQILAIISVKILWVLLNTLQTTSIFATATSQVLHTNIFPYRVVLGWRYVHQTTAVSLPKKRWFDAAVYWFPEWFLVFTCGGVYQALSWQLCWLNGRGYIACVTRLTLKNGLWLSNLWI